MYKSKNVLRVMCIIWVSELIKKYIVGLFEITINESFNQLIIRNILFCIIMFHYSENNWKCLINTVEKFKIIEKNNEKTY